KVALYWACGRIGSIRVVSGLSGACQSSRGVYRLSLLGRQLLCHGAHNATRSRLVSQTVGLSDAHSAVLWSIRHFEFIARLASVSCAAAHRFDARGCFLFAQE